MVPELVPDDVGSWAPSLWHDHVAVAAEDRRVAYAINCYLCSNKSLYTSILRDAHLLPTLLRILESDCVCGFDEDQFIVGTNMDRIPYFTETVVPYIVHIFRIITATLADLRTVYCDHDHDGQSEPCETCIALDLEQPVSLSDVCSKLVSFFKVFGRIRHPIVLRKTRAFYLRVSFTYDAGDEETTETEPIVTSVVLGTHLMVVIGIMLDIFKAYQGCSNVQPILAEFVQAGVRILADVWLSAETPETRQDSLRRMVEVMIVYMGNNWTPQYGDVCSWLNDGIPPHLIQRSIIDGLAHSFWGPRAAAEEIDRFNRFRFILAVVVLLREKPLEATDVLHTSRNECGILWHVLAVSRTLVCAGDLGSPEEPIHSYLCTVEGTSTYIILAMGDPHDWEEPPIPELWAFALANHLAGGVALAVDSASPFVEKLTDTWLGELRRLAHMFQHYRTHANDHPRFRGWPGSEPVPPSARRFLRDLWLTVERTLTRRRRHRNLRGARVGELLRQWADFRIQFDYVFELEGEPETTFGPLERCAWNGCACSVFEPTHNMKVCTGCRLTAYCSKRCQKMDYDRHRVLCGTHGA